MRNGEIVAELDKDRLTDKTLLIILWGWQINESKC